jgi:23S rRNA (cytosine1962-C5)-methyltransferase
VNRQFVWPTFLDAWIVHDDGDIVVVDKPAGMPSQSTRPDGTDDVVARLGAHLGGAYLGVHQRLDKDTSGLLVFARRREANAGLAAQFEGRNVEKTYIACVTGWPNGKQRASMRAALAPDKNGAMRVVAEWTPGAKVAVTHANALSRRADRAMLELRLASGRTHQARVQLAHAGAPIAGDVLYGGAPAPRLLLHASAIALQHPLTGEHMRFASPLPAEFEVWLSRGDLAEGIYEDEAAIHRALRVALERRWAFGRSDATSLQLDSTGKNAEEENSTTTAFRLVNDAGDALPRLAVDVYGSWLVAQLYADSDPGGGLWGNAVRRERLLGCLHALGFDGIYLKVRPRQANVVVETRREDLAPAFPVRGRAAPFEFGILEDGMPLLVRLGDGLSTGLFLDQRGNRRRIRELAKGKRVANLFAYTCAFTVAAALGGARRTVSVDASIVALERGKSNLANAKVIDRGEHVFVVADAFSWISHAVRSGEHFDLVILDPPSYSTTKRGRFVAATDYADLAASAFELLAPRGKLLACTNHRGIPRSRFRRVLFEAARAAKREVKQMKDVPASPDYPVPPGGEPHTKSALVTVA